MEVEVARMAIVVRILLAKVAFRVAITVKMAVTHKHSDDVALKHQM